MKGRVIKSTGSWYIVQAEGQLFRARLRGKFKLDELKLTNPISVGDYVEMTLEQELETALIETILPRKNYIIRKSTRKTGFSHILASNIDQAFLIVTIKNPRTSLGFIDRFLVSTESFRIPASLIINKMDLIKKEKDLEFLQDIEEIYAPLGYPVIKISAIGEKGQTGGGQVLDEELEALLKGKTTLLAGHSGVGKSTILNKLIPEANQAVNEVSSFTSKGTHTTTFAEMFEFGKDGYLIDTPGIKEFGILDIEDQELSHYFVEMRAYLGQCKYNNCQHVHEPECKVIEAVEEGFIHPYRYDSYVRILHEEDSYR